jgi:hypothetical protein
MPCGAFFSHLTPDLAYAATYTDSLCTPITRHIVASIDESKVGNHADIVYY